MPPLIHFDALPGGTIPRVVGTICQLDFLRRAADGSAGPIVADLVEVRLDETGWTDEVFGLARQLNNKGIPLLATVRSSKEGGKYSGDDRERLRIYELALEIFSEADVELKSTIARDLVKVCSQKKRGSIISFHNFQATPSLEHLQEVYDEASEFAPLVKMVTMLKSESDLATLRTFLARKRNVPLCLMGMGPLGRATRLDFPLEGSALTYGYLDAPAAPGQLSAAEIAHYLQAKRSA